MNDNIQHDTDREREIVRKLSSSEEHQARGKSSETPKES